MLIIQIIRTIDAAICEMIIKRFSQKWEYAADLLEFVLRLNLLKKVPDNIPENKAIITANMKSDPIGKIKPDNGIDDKSANTGGLLLQISYVKIKARENDIKVYIKFPDIKALISLFLDAPKQRFIVI